MTVAGAVDGNAVEASDFLDRQVDVVETDGEDNQPSLAVPFNICAYSSAAPAFK